MDLTASEYRQSSAERTAPLTLDVEKAELLH